MATFRDGILGGFKGLVGTVIGSTWRTLNVMKKRPKPSSKPPVQSQVDQRIKFGLMTDFLSQVKRHISLGFQSYKGVLTPMNGAVKLNITRAFTGTSPNFVIDYSKIVLSIGNLPGTVDLAMTVSPGMITFNWSAFDNGFAEEKAIRDTDLLVLLIYHPVLGKSLSAFGISTRAGLSVDFEMLRLFNGSPVHVWVYWMAADKKNVSASTYLGPVTVPQSV